MIRHNILKSTILFLLIVLFILPSGVFANGTTQSSKQFSDVKNGHWAYDAINWMTGKGILDGYDDGTFKPDNPVSRAEFAAMMVRALELTKLNPEKQSFKDVGKSDWAYKYVESAKYYLTGYRTANGDYFRPDRPAVREDMAVALVKALGYANETADESKLANYSDKAEISVNLKKYVLIAIDKGLMDGYETPGKNTREFKPQNTLTRAEAALLLYRAIDSAAEKVTYEEEKVTYDNYTTPDYEAPVLTGDAVSGKIVLEWNVIKDERLAGYKVVISKNDSTPKYPENGYFEWITDKNHTSSVVKAGDCYNGGDFGGRLESGETYYFSITAVYNKEKVTGNVIKLRVP